MTVACATSGRSHGLDLRFTEEKESVLRARVGSRGASATPSAGAHPEPAHARLAVIYREVGYTADRRVAAEGGVAAVMIVEMQPAGKRGGAGRLAAVDADVGPPSRGVRLKRSTLPLVCGR